MRYLGWLIAVAKRFILLRFGEFWLYGPRRITRRESGRESRIVNLST